MAIPRERIYTSEDYWNLPEGQRSELIDGTLYNMTPPSPFHQELIMEISATIREYVKKRNGNCKVYPAPLAVNLHADDKVWVEPDISIICDKNKITDRECKGAPDWIIEIVSPSSRKRDYSTKMLLYSDAGVREYWIVDPAKERTTVYMFEEDAAPIIIPFNQAIFSGIYKDFQITISNLL